MRGKRKLRLLRHRTVIRQRPRQGKVLRHPGIGVEIARNDHVALQSSHGGEHGGNFRRSDNGRLDHVSSLEAIRRLRMHADEMQGAVLCRDRRPQRTRMVLPAGANRLRVDERQA